MSKAAHLRSRSFLKARSRTAPTQERHSLTCEEATYALVPRTSEKAMTQAQKNYADYLTTDYWQKVSNAVKTRAGYRCQVCNSELDLQAHHRTYAHRGSEMDHLVDLICLCRRCHCIFHGATGNWEAPIQPNPAPKPPEMVLITRANCDRLKCTKEPWHWMLKEGINPKKSKWKLRAIGYTVPETWLRF